ncbi:hypothetical protein L6R50_25170 [Myxococcota bacterium]|nr:hypothetical protein [Myxococcota bacterium]
MGTPRTRTRSPQGGRRGLPALAALGLAAGCVPPPDAPEELSDLTRYMYREWDSEDPRVLGIGAGNLEDILLGFDLDGDVDDRAFVQDDLVEDDVDHLVHPDEPVDDCVPIAVAARSRYGIDWHALFAIEVDQRPAEPTATEYERRFLDPEDPECFAEGSCGTLGTENEITRSNILYTVSFVMPKDFAWVEIMKDTEPTGRRAIVARSWLDRSWPSDDGNTDLQQSFTLDVWIEAEDGSTLRYQALWSDTEIPGIDSDEAVQYFTKDGIADALAAGDDAISTLYSP